MKRLLAIIVLFTLILSICSCAETNVPEDADVNLVFVYMDKNINVTLEDDEASKIISILDERSYGDSTSCSFDKNISIKIGIHTYAIARDGCNTIMDLGTLKQFDIPESDMEYIHSVFEKYDCYFPCV